MKKTFIILLILGGIGIIAAGLVYQFYVNKNHPDFDKQKAEFVIDASDLYLQFTNETPHAENLYLDKMIEIEGEIESVEQVDSMVILNFVFSEGIFGSEGIRCTVLEKYKEECRSYQSYTKVKLKGVCKGYNGTDVVMEKCSIIKD